MDEARRLQLNRFAAMTPAERLRVAAGLSTLALRLRTGSYIGRTTPRTDALRTAWDDCRQRAGEE